MAKSEGEHVVKEIYEHLIMEKTGALPGQHFLPKKKRPKKSSNFGFYFFMSLFILGELWVIYELIID